MYYIVYKTTCKITGKYYIGVHKQKDLLEVDGYYGSGLLLVRSLEKYGVDNHYRETLFVFDNKHDAFQKEKEIVTQELICEDDCLNLCVGGQGGDKFFLKSKEEIKAIGKKIIETKIKNNTLKDSDETKKKKSESSKIRIEKYPNSIPNNKNRKHVGEGLQNIKNAAVVRTGKYVWITNGKEEKLVNRDVDLEIGWYFGRSDETAKFIEHTLESRQKISNSPKIRGVVCYTNGVDNIKLQKNEHPPEGYRRGLTQKHNSIWITNGIVSKKHPSLEEIPDGWRNGRTFNKNGK